MDSTTNTTPVNWVSEELERENTRLQNETIRLRGIIDDQAAAHEALANTINRLTAVNAAQSDMLRGAAEAAAQQHTESCEVEGLLLELHKLIAGVLFGVDTLSPMEALTRLLALRREYADVCDHA